MTKPRDPLSFGAAIKKIADAIGMTTAARVVGRSERTVQHWSETDRPGLPTLDQAIALDKAYIAAGGNHAPIADCFLNQIDGFTANLTACRVELANDVALVSREAGDAINHCIQALLPGATPATIRTAIVETEDVDALLPRLIGRLHALLPGNGGRCEVHGESR